MLTCHHSFGLCGDGDVYGAVCDDDGGVVVILVVVMVMMMVVGVWEEAFVRFLQLSECGSLSQQPTEENCYKFASNQRKFVSQSK